MQQRPYILRLLEQIIRAHTRYIVVFYLFILFLSTPSDAEFTGGFLLICIIRNAAIKDRRCWGAAFY